MKVFIITVILAFNGTGEKITTHERFLNMAQCESYLKTYVNNLESQGAFVSKAECGEN